MKTPISSTGTILYQFVCILFTCLGRLVAGGELVALCNGTVYVMGGRLNSQLSSNYDDNLDCIVTLRPIEPYQRLLLNFDWIDFEKYENGCVDYLEIYDGADTSMRPIQRFCGNYVPFDVVSSSDSITLRLVSDATKTGKGFSIVYSAFYDGISQSCNSIDHFKCNNDRCVNGTFRCNDVDNCGDLSDEWYCPGSLIPLDSRDLLLVINGGILAICLFLMFWCCLYYYCIRRQGNRKPTPGPGNDYLQLRKRRKQSTKDYVMYAHSTTPNMTHVVEMPACSNRLPGIRHSI
ncbi:low-density lipoprotein receptor-related protein 3-like [Glandiceps talaboti]